MREVLLRKKAPGGGSYEQLLPSCVAVGGHEDETASLPEE